MPFKTGNYNVFDDLIHADLIATEEAFETGVVPFVQKLWDNMVGKGAEVSNESLDAGFEFSEESRVLPTYIKFRMGFIVDDFKSDVTVDDGAVEADEQTIAKYFSQFDNVKCDPKDVEIDTTTGSCSVTVHLPVSSTTFILDELRAQREEEEKRAQEREKDVEDRDDYGFNLL